MFYIACNEINKQTILESGKQSESNKVTNNLLNVTNYLYWFNVNFRKILHKKLYLNRRLKLAGTCYIIKNKYFSQI